MNKSVYLFIRLFIQHYMTTFLQLFPLRTMLACRCHSTYCRTSQLTTSQASTTAICSV